MLPLLSHPQRDSAGQDRAQGHDRKLVAGPVLLLNSFHDKASRSLNPFRFDRRRRLFPPIDVCSTKQALSHARLCCHERMLLV